jgi:hypothetical protein
MNVSTKSCNPTRTPSKFTNGQELSLPRGETRTREGRRSGQAARPLPIAAHERRTDRATPNSFRSQPDDRGHFGQFGGRYVAETLMPLILDLEQEYRKAKADPHSRPSSTTCSNTMSAAQPAISRPG